MSGTLISEPSIFVGIISCEKPICGISNLSTLSADIGVENKQKAISIIIKIEMIILLLCFIATLYHEKNKKARVF